MSGICLWIVATVGCGSGERVSSKPDVTGERDATEDSESEDKAARLPTDTTSDDAGEADEHHKPTQQEIPPDSPRNDEEDTEEKTPTQEDAAEKPSRSEKDTPVPKYGDVLTNSIGMKLVLIPAGEFLMGTPESAEDGEHNEVPQHSVLVSKPFFMGVYEVTQGEYEEVMGDNPSHFSENGAGRLNVAGKDTSDFPVENMIWEQAVEFCQRLSDRPEEKEAGRSYRLPTEAEWEYACRAGSQTFFHFGNTLSSDMANMNGVVPYGLEVNPDGLYLERTTKVGSYKPNNFGLYDMHGNVAEWCADSPREYNEKAATDPVGTSDEARRAVRGGAWVGFGEDCRSAWRLPALKDRETPIGGFRVVVDVPANHRFEMALQTLLRGLEEAADALESVKDESSARRGIPKLKQVSKQMRIRQKIMEAMDPSKELPATEGLRLQEYYTPKLNDAAERLKRERARVSGVAGGAEALRAMSNPD